jgi:hypothetical protein
VRCSSSLLGLAAILLPITARRWQVLHLLGTSDSGCDFVSPNEIKTHENRDVAFRPKAPDPGGLWRNEKLTIEVEVFNLNGPQPWTASWEITMVQAKELSQWLTIRAKEAKRGERFNRFRRLLLRLGRS